MKFVDDVHCPHCRCPIRVTLDIEEDKRGCLVECKSLFEDKGCGKTFVIEYSAKPYVRCLKIGGK